MNSLHFNTHHASQQSVGPQSRKRTREEAEPDLTLLDPRITGSVIKRFRSSFNAEPANIIADAVMRVGLEYAATNHEEAREVDHIFQHTIRSVRAKASNQEMTGRCWMFAGMNVFRHLLMKALGMKNLEFSATYLFFWDKFERANSYLMEIIETLDKPAKDRYVECLLATPIQDGGTWETFTNLVDKYGLTPKSVMPETYHSGYSKKINLLIKHKLLACANYMRKNHKRVSVWELLKEKDKTLEQVYGILRKFLGSPPEKFTWSYQDKSHKPHTIEATPKEFANLVQFDGFLAVNEFAVIGHFPNKTYHRRYEFESSSNVIEGRPETILNLTSRQLQMLVVEQLSNGIPVWFAADVSHGVHHEKCAFNEKLIDEESLFGETHRMTKAERLSMRASSPNHAMCITGFSVDDNGMPTKFQVENSWGAWDDETPGLDGYYEMSAEWFDNNVFEVVILKKFLTNRLREELKRDTILVKPWDPLASAFRLP